MHMGRVVLKACNFSKSATLDGSTHLLIFKIIQTWVEMVSEADNAFLHVHLDHTQPKSQSQDYLITWSAIWSQNLNCARTWANSKAAEKMFVPKPLAKGQCIPGMGSLERTSWTNTMLDAWHAKLSLFFVFLTVAMVLTKSNIGPYKSL